jgi:hypothetical protein
MRRRDATSRRRIRTATVPVFPTADPLFFQTAEPNGLFDELMSYPGWRFGMLRALNKALTPDHYLGDAFEDRRAHL